ncbi:MAG: KH domain-containing protein [bacterium]|nr:KH domain-containing protein [bacterium]
MRELAQYLVEAVAEQVDAVKIEETTDEYGTLILTASVSEEDMGRLIGKGGKTVRAIRQLLRIRAIRDNVRVHFELKDQ